MSNAADLARAKAEIDRMYGSLDRRDHFALLGVEPETPPDQLRAAYHFLAKKWHADNFANVDLGPHKQKLDSIFQRIGEAYETLSTPKKREEYMVLVHRQSAGLSTDVNSILRAEQLVDDAMMEIRKKSWKAAIEHLSEAKRLNKDDPLYDVHLAWATYNVHHNKESAARAIGMLRDAAKRQENLPLGYQYGGQIFFAQEEYGEATKWWKKCLEWDPKNVEALRGLRLINTRAQKKKQGLGALFNKLIGKD
ncbi:MAG: DnaJ domain-containing protein [Myxococcales bacterium]|nr:DnaJ domain-containing protein [Myxococcales bacterium]